MKEYPEWQQRRIKAKKEGSLPYSFMASHALYADVKCGGM